MFLFLPQNDHISHLWGRNHQDLFLLLSEVFPRSNRGFLLKINPLLRRRWLFPVCIQALFKVNCNISNRFHPRLWNNATNTLFMDIPAWHHVLLFSRLWVFDYSITWLWQGSHLFTHILLLLIQPDMGGTSGKHLGKILFVCAGAWVGGD